MKIFAVVAVTTLTVIVAISLFMDETFLVTGTTVLRILVSIGAGIFATCCAATVASFFASGYFFIKMINSPQSGKTIFDARMLKGKSLFANDYLSEAGKIARTRFLKSLLCFFACWIGGVSIFAAMQLSIHGF
jgi:tRNA(His) 5'-end guanylyltransferase